MKKSLMLAGLTVLSLSAFAKDSGPVQKERVLSSEVLAVGECALTKSTLSSTMQGTGRGQGSVISWSSQASQSVVTKDKKATWLEDKKGNIIPNTYRVDEITDSHEKKFDAHVLAYSSISESGSSTQIYHDANFTSYIGSTAYYPSVVEKVQKLTADAQKSADIQASNKCKTGNEAIKSYLGLNNSTGSQDDRNISDTGREIAVNKDSSGNSTASKKQGNTKQ